MGKYLVVIPKRVGHILSREKSARAQGEVVEVWRCRVLQNPHGKSSVLHPGSQRLDEGTDFPGGFWNTQHHSGTNNSCVYPNSLSLLFNYSCL